MSQLSLARGWEFDVERGPDWLFIRPRRAHAGQSGSPFRAEQVWWLMEQNFTHRLVLELGEIGTLDAHWIEQILWLKRKIDGTEGMMRICGLSDANKALLKELNFESRFGDFQGREDAVMGHPPRQPR